MFTSTLVCCGTAFRRARKKPRRTDTNMASPRVGPREVIYKDEYQQIYRVTADFGSFTKDYFVRDSGKRAGLVVAQGGSVLLVRQYRLLIDGLSWEIPGGKVDDGETPEVAAVRECLEEAGVRCQNLKPLLSYHPGLDIVHNPTYVFYTEDFVETAREHLNVSEVIQHLWIPLGHCIEMVFAQQIVDGLSIVALLAYQKLKAR